MLGKEPGDPGWRGSLAPLRKLQATHLPSPGLRTSAVTLKKEGETHLPGLPLGSSGLDVM